jgi:hypothetical protein
MNAGAMEASNMPRNILAIRSPVKLCAAEDAATVIPQASMLKNTFENEIQC